MMSMLSLHCPVFACIRSYIQVRALHCTSDHLEIQHLTELGEVKPEFILIPNWYEVHFKCSTQNI